MVKLWRYRGASILQSPNLESACYRVEIPREPAWPAGDGESSRQYSERLW